MSYILEALKKSQRERELGHVPTLRTPILVTEDEVARPNLWILLSVLLASLAVAIALYTALRGGSTISQPVEAVDLTSSTEVAESEVEDPGQSLPPAAGAEPLSAASGSPAPDGGPQMAGPSESEAASPAVAPEAHAAPPARRQRPAPVPESVAQEPQEPEQEEREQVPPDLIADIEAFKRELSDEGPREGAATEAETQIAPRDLRLPKDVRERLPAFVMSAHIYDSEPSKRFVLINGLKTREGEESREEIGVERILPEGAVLRFEDHRFFQAR